MPVSSRPTSGGPSFVTVRCAGCGEPRQLSLRQSLRAGLCRRCLYPPKVPPVGDDDRRWALEHFSDAEIVEIASALSQLPGSLEHVRRERDRLIGAREDAE